MTCTSIKGICKFRFKLRIMNEWPTVTIRKCQTTQSK